MLQRRGKKTERIERGSDGPIIWSRTEDALVLFVEHGKITKEIVKSILKLSKPSDGLTILVHKNSLTPDAKNALEILQHVRDESLNDTKPVFSMFTYDEMSFDLIETVPPHSLVAGPKPKELQKFPIILATEPVARYYAFQRGDVIRVEEEADDGPTVSFRRCW